MPMKQSGSGAVHRPVRRLVSTTSQYIGTASGNYPGIGTILATVGGETVGLSIVIGDGEVSITGREATIIDVVPHSGSQPAADTTRMWISMMTAKSHLLMHS